MTFREVVSFGLVVSGFTLMAVAYARAGWPVAKAFYAAGRVDNATAAAMNDANSSGWMFVWIAGVAAISGGLFVASWSP